MKKKIITLAATTLLLSLLTSCGGPEVVSLVPVYKGAEVTDTNHEFTTDDFDIYLTYEDGSQSIADDYTLEIKGMKAGYYILEITADDFTEEAYVPINVPVYPSDVSGESK
ncbi:MAG: hypothetical protein ACI4XJ_11650 [Eubacteriales bacterium]